MSDDLDEIREELANRRQGRWYVGNRAGGVWCHREGEHSALDEQVCDCNPHDYRTYYEAHADAAFIANAPKRIATLLARIDDLRAERDRLRAALMCVRTDVQAARIWRERDRAGGQNTSAPQLAHLPVSAMLYMVSTLKRAGIDPDGEDDGG